MDNKSRWLLLFGISLVLLVKGNEVVAMGLVSWSSVELGSSATVVTPSSDMAKIESRLRLAAGIAPHNPVVHRALARFHSLQGDWRVAAQELEKALEYAPGNELARFNLANAYDRMGERHKATEQYEILQRAGRLGPVGREWLVTNYVELVQQSWREDGCSSETRSWLARIFAADPSNFFASAVWFLSCANSESAEFGASPDALRFYEINPGNAREVRVVCSLILDLVESELWTLEDVETFLELLNWYGFTGEVESICTALLGKYPERAFLRYHLALAYAREGKLSAALSNAEEAVRRSKPGGPEHRLLCRLRLRTDEGAVIGCLREYRRSNPDDQWGLFSLTALGEGLDTSLALQEKVASLLGLRPDDVRIGPNLVRDPGFEEKGSFWSWFAHTGLIGTTQYYPSLTLKALDDTDAFDGKWSSRGKVVWVDRRKGEGFTVGLNSMPDNAVELEPGAWYVFSFFYRSDIAITLVRSGTGLMKEKTIGLPPSDANWARFTLVGQGEEDAPVRFGFIIQLWRRIGDVRVDDMTIAKVEWDGNAYDRGVGNLCARGIMRVK